MTRTRIAVMGLGMAAAPHARSLIDLRDRVETVSCYSPTAARRDSFAKTCGLPVSGDIEAIFADRTIDAVLLLTPPNTHLDLVRRAAGAGKHILLEKPLEISTERSEALVAAAREAGVTLGVVFQHRFRAGSAALANLIAEGRLGAIVGASATIRNWRPQSYYDQPGRGDKARDGGGVLLTQAIHTLDLLVALAGLPAAVAAFAATSAIHRMETEDIAACALRYPNGAIGTINATTCAFPGLPGTIEIIGEKGMAALEEGDLRASFHDGTSLSVEDETGHGAGADPMAFSHAPHRAVLSDFIDAIETGRPPKITGEDALKVHDLIEAILDSANEGGSARSVRRREN